MTGFAPFSDVRISLDLMRGGGGGSMGGFGSEGMIFIVISDVRWLLNVLAGKVVPLHKVRTRGAAIPKLVHRASVRLIPYPANPSL